MADGRILVRLAAAFLVIFFLIGSHDVEARGGRGGGGRGGYRGGSSRGSARFGSSRGIRSYRGPSYRSSYWGTGMAIGYLYGVSSYKRRRIYRDNPSREPQVCYNEQNLKNGTYGYFICPLPEQDDDYTYCCGDEDAQRCCRFFDDGGRVAGVVIGIIAFCVILGVAVYCFCTRCRSRKPSAGKVYQPARAKNSSWSKNNTTSHTGSAGNDIPMTTNTYGVQPASYDSGAAGLPYNPNPNGPKAPLPESDTSTTDPYRAAPGIGFTFDNHPTSQPAAQNYGQGPGQQYPPTAPPPYPGGN